MIARGKRSTGLTVLQPWCHPRTYGEGWSWKKYRASSCCSISAGTPGTFVLTTPATSALERALRPRVRHTPRPW